MVPAAAPAPRLTTWLHMPLSDDTAILTCMVRVAVRRHCSLPVSPGHQAGKCQLGGSTVDSRCQTARGVSALLSTGSAAEQNGIVHADSSAGLRMYTDSGSACIAVS